MKSLRAKLITPFIAGTLVLTLLLAWYTYTSAKKAVHDATLLISESYTDNACGSMTLLLKSMTTALQNMVADNHVTSLFTEHAAREDSIIKSRTTDWLEIIILGNEYYRDIVIVDKNGICIASSNPSHIGRSYLDRDYVQQALSGFFTLGEPSVGLVTKKFSASAAGPVDLDGNIVGALIVFNDFPKIVDYAQASEAVFTAMLSPEGVFMAHRDKNIMGAAPENSGSLYRELAKAGERGEPVEYKLNGEGYVGYAKVEPSTKWVVISSGLKSEVYSSAQEQGLVVLLISLAFLGVISFIVIRFANGILSSLLSLISYAKNVSEGELEQQLEDTNRQDELGVLHNSLQRLVESLRDMLLKTQEASKMKGQFLANMSHEIRTPLNAIIGMAHLSLRESSILPKQRDYLEKIQIAAKSLLGVINDVLDLSKVEAGMLSLEHLAFNLRETLENMLAIHQSNASAKSLLLELDYDAGAPQNFLGDAMRIGQVLNNLLSNAIKFTSEGGIMVRCSCVESGAEFAVMRVSVRDTGIGMSVDALDNLFKPFTQADASITRQYGGTGLGLAISHKIVELLEGEFSVKSVPGKGTTFSFTMRLEINHGFKENADEVGEGIDELQAALSMDLSSKRILVAEDNAINQLIMQELIAPTGAQIIMVDNGRQAIDAVRGDSFDLVFMDVQMPVMDGLEATRHIREFIGEEELPIIAVTANAMKEDREKSMAVGMNSYITKPIEPAELMRILNQFLAKDS